MKRILRGVVPLALAALTTACATPHRVWAAPPASSAPASAAPSPKGKLTIVEARKYMLELVNADRRSMGLPPVTLDEGPAQHAAESHARDMAANGYLGHWGTDGSFPELRASEAGGADMVMENASCFVDETHRVLDHDARIDPEEIAKTESMFFNESPPNDGHRKNILKPWHTKVAIGIAQPRASLTEIPVPCVAQEFVDDYGSYASLPPAAHVGDRIRVEGTLRSPAVPVGVGLARVDLPKALTPREANARRSYPVPAPYEMFWTAGYKTRIPLRVNGEAFAIDLALDDHAKPGTYEVSVWAKVPQSPDFIIVGLRTIRVEAKVDGYTN